MHRPRPWLGRQYCITMHNSGARVDGAGPSMAAGATRHGAYPWCGKLLAIRRDWRNDGASPRSTIEQLRVHPTHVINREHVAYHQSLFPREQGCREGIAAPHLEKRYILTEKGLFHRCPFHSTLTPYRSKVHHSTPLRPPLRAEDGVNPTLLSFCDKREGDIRRNEIVC